MSPALEKYEAAKLLAGHIEIVETIVLEEIGQGNDHITGFATEVLSRVPNTLLTQDALKDVWEIARNRDQSIVDWIMDTYRKVVLSCGSKAILDEIREVYIESLFIGNIADLYSDSDLGDRIVSNRDDALELLKQNNWAIILLAMFSLDLTDEENRTETTS